MQLKYVEIQGFKSFPDKKRLVVSPGMTVIVGPNGSGKSNISDAIRWVLGEMSSKNMRGSKMEDVIFGGCDTRRPMGFAEVSIAFDNTVGEMRIPLPYDEVCVTRKYYRSGGSEYMINRNPVRLKDINDLFMNTGLGKSGYSIIGQGRIAEIISKKSEDRRGIFEEAAGISRYRAKKNEAERKLAEVEINLSQAEILRNELSSQLGPLEKQSEKAKKFVALREEKKKADIAVWLYEIANVNAKTSELNDKCEITRHEYEMAVDSLNNLQSRQDILLENSRNSARDIEENTRKIRELTDKKHTEEENLAVMHAEIVHTDENIKRLRDELDDIRRSGGKAADETAALSNILKDAEDKVEKLRAQFAQCELELSSIRLEIAENDSLIEEKEAQIQEISGRIVDKRLDLTSMKTSAGGNDERREQLENELISEKEKYQSSKESENDILKTISAYEKACRAADGEISQEKGKLSKLSERLKNLTDRKNNTQIEFTSLSRHCETLKRMEEHFDGFANGVKLVMEWSNQGSLDGIIGPVSGILSLDSRYALAIEASLGASLQNIVCENERAAKKAIGMLKENRGGVVTFYPLNTMRPSRPSIDENKLARCHGYIGFANRLVTCDKKYSNVVDYLLCRTVICETLDDATEIGKAFDYSFRIVTLDGQTVNAGGSLTGGSRKSGGGILTRRAEIEKLSSSISEKQHELEDIESESMKTGRNIDELTNIISELESKREITNALLSSALTQKAISEGKNSDLKESISRLENEIRTLNDRENENERLIEKTEKEVSALEQELEDKKNLFSELKKTRGENEILRGQIIDRKNSIDSKIGSALASLEYTKKEIANSSEKALSLAEQEKKNSSAIELLILKKEEYRSRISEASQCCKRLEGEIKALDDRSAELRLVADSFEKDSAILFGQIKDKTVTRDNLYKILTRLEEQARAAEFDNEKYLTFLSDEYDMTYAEALEFPHEELNENTKQSAVNAQNKFKRQIRELGDVNVGAIDEYAEKKARFETLDKQYTDLIAAKEDYSSIAKDMEGRMKSLFVDTFGKINENFGVVFTELFGGGKGVLSLTDPDNVLESGIEINVAPPGKIIKSLSLLSGGEQVFVAIALFFAILRVSPAPFCLLDEIEAALDEVNVSRFANYAKKYSGMTQFIIITHRRGTMEAADTLYGVVMQQRGITNLLSIEVNEVESKLGLKDLK